MAVLRLCHGSRTKLKFQTLGNTFCPYYLATAQMQTVSTPNIIPTKRAESYKWDAKQLEKKVEIFGGKSDQRNSLKTPGKS